MTSTTTTPQTLEFSAEVNLTAADQAKPGTISIVAYSGGQMRPSGHWGDVVVDLEKLSLPSRLPILAGHQNSIDQTLGTGTPRVESGQLLVDGVLSRATEAARTVIELNRDGVSFQASVGMSVTKQRRIQSGDSIRVNGRTITAGPSGLALVESGELREVSIVPLGGDPQTSAAIAAKGTTTMSTEAQQSDLEAIRKEERDRLRKESQLLEARLQALEGMDGGTELQSSLRKQFHAGEIDFDQVQDTLLAAIRNDRPKSIGPAIHSSGGPSDKQMLEAAFALHVNAQMAESSYDAQVLEAANHVPLTSMLDLARICADMERKPYNARNKDSVLEAAFSTNTYSNVVSNVANKSLQTAYRSFPSVAKQITRMLNAKDFKEHTGIRLSGETTFLEIGNTGEIKHGSLDDSAYKYRIATYGRMIGISRQDAINDDLSALDEIPRMLGRGCAQAIEELFWSLFLSNSGNFFSSDNRNQTSDPLSSAGLSALAQLFMEQVDERDRPIAAVPKWLVVPPALKTLGDELYVSTNHHSSGGGEDRVPSSNTHASKYQPMVAPWIGSKGLEGGSDEAFYLFGDPSDIPAFGIAYLSGKSEPTIEMKEMEPSRLGMTMRGYLDFGVCQIDHRGAAQSTGLGGSGD